MIVIFLTAWAGIRESTVLCLLKWERRKEWLKEEREKAAAAATGGRLEEGRRKEDGQEEKVELESGRA